MRYRRRPLRRTILPLVLALALPLLGGCSEKLLGPSYPFEGEWSGTLTDPTIILSTGRALKLDIAVRVNEQGQGRISTERVLAYGGGSVTIRVNIEMEVMPDGAVSGSGSYTLSSPFNLLRYGLIVGQFDLQAGRWTGTLALAEDGSMPLTHMGWVLRRTQ